MALLSLITEQSTVPCVPTISYSLGIISGSTRRKVGFISGSGSFRGLYRYHVFQDLWKPWIGEKLVAKQEFNNPMDKHSVKVVKGDETVGHLSHKFSQIA